MRYKSGRWHLRTALIKRMKRISMVMFLLVAMHAVASAQEPPTNQRPVLIQSIANAFLSLTNTPGPTFGIFSAMDDVAHRYTRNRAATFVGNAVAGTGVDLTAIPVWSNWDSPPPTGGNPYGGARFNGILVTADILLQAHHPWGASGYAPQTIYFVDNTNQTVAMSVLRHQGVAGTDIEVVRLTERVPPSITPALVFATGSIAHSVMPVLWTDQYRELYVGVAVPGKDFVTVAQVAGSPFNSYWATVHDGVVSGDSGAPYMTVVNGRLVALGTWITGGATRGGGSSFESRVAEINAVIKELGSSTRLQTVSPSGNP